MPRIKKFICTSCYATLPCKLEIHTGVVEDIQPSTLVCVMRDSKDNTPDWKLDTPKEEG